MKSLAAAILSTLALTASAERTASVNIPRVDLNLPGAWDALKKSDPGRYARVRKELEKVSTMPCQYSGPAVIHTTPRYGGEDARCATEVYTSFPAKRRVTVWVDDTIYEALVSLRDSGGRLAPAVDDR